ncbi:hypothetical protein [Hymenobacter elongatus]|uniref:Lipoprotein n=1 Tax=Hymenobacter elongatus TaxID=877208 RepID=A0A4Z0PL26_9BACT|nr:hypothetical protein [Hymenobacter elongatus]TGE16834.1 hypothetical protein E5J99_08985 [Hymenobacter elongatus]
MKTRLLFAAVALLASCTSSPEKKAESAVSEYVGNRLGNPRNYRAGRFTTKPYTRHDSVAYATSVARLTTDTSAGPQPPISLPAAAGAVRIGTFVSHAYHEETQNGSVSRDSGEFVVYPSGDVVQLMPGTRLRQR